MRDRGLTATLAAVLALAGASVPTASAHVAPSVDTNNRYLKLSAMGDRIRLVYTVYVGEVPGAQARRRMDTDRDGVLSDTEAQAYGDDTAQAVARGLSIQLDGRPVTVTWSEVDVGTGTPAVDAGSFSVDLVAWLCIADAGASRTHQLSLFDHFELPRPGETELRVEASPGLRIDRSTLGEDGAHSQLEFKWRGDGGPTSTLGFFLDYTVDASVDLGASPCPPPAAGAAVPEAARASKPKGRNATTAIALAMAAVVLIGVAAVVVIRRRRAT